MSVFKKAERKQAKLKIALTGPSGSGKTYSALAIAGGLGSRVAVIDTENSSASLYSDTFGFDVLELTPPYTIEKYREAIQTAIKAGYDCLVVDSISHAWAGEGGLLEQKESLDSRGGNSYANWGKITKQHESFKSQILNADIHMICTMRSKQEYALQQDEKGKTVVKKLGLAPVQRDGLEYEFTAVLDLAMDHSAEASKDRTGLFDGRVFRPSADTGRTLAVWLATGTNANHDNGTKDPILPVVAVPKAGARHAQDINEALKTKLQAGWTTSAAVQYMKQAFGVSKIGDLTEAQADELIMVIGDKSVKTAFEWLNVKQGRAS